MPTDTSPAASIADVTRRLLACGVREPVAAALAEGGMHAVVDGRLFAVAHDEDPVTGARRALVPVGGAHLAADPALVHGLVAACRRRDPSTTQVVVTLPPGSPLPELPVGRPLLRYLRATDRVATPEPPAGWEVRRPAPGEAGTVRRLLETALADGYSDFESGVEPGTVAREAARLFEQASSTGSIFVATCAGAFAGHATLLHDTDELTGEERWELFDMFVLPPWRRSPAGGLLVGAAVSHARVNGDLPLRGQVSGYGEAADRVYRNLQDAGWEADATYWRIDVSDVPAPWA